MRYSDARQWCLNSERRRRFCVLLSAVYHAMLSVRRPSLTLKSRGPRGVSLAPRAKGYASRTKVLVFFACRCVSETKASVIFAKRWALETKASVFFTLFYTSAFSAVFFFPHPPAKREGLHRRGSQRQEEVKFECSLSLPSSSPLRSLRCSSSLIPQLSSFALRTSLRIPLARWYTLKLINNPTCIPLRRR